MKNNIEEISIDEIKQVNGSLIDPLTDVAVIGAVAAVVTVGYLAYEAAYNAGRDRAIRDNNLGLNQ